MYTRPFKIDACHIVGEPEPTTYCNTLRKLILIPTQRAFLSFLPCNLQSVGGEEEIVVAYLYTKRKHEDSKTTLPQFSIYLSRVNMSGAMAMLLLL